MKKICFSYKTLLAAAIIILCDFLLPLLAAGLYAARLIREGVNANKAASDAGFSDYSTFHRAFRESFSISPGELKK